MNIDKLLCRALELRDGSQRLVRSGEVGYAFNYVLLDRNRRDHRLFYVEIDRVLELYAGKKEVHARLSYYREGDSIGSHLDELGAYCAMSIRLDGGESRLKVNGVVVNEGGGVINCIGSRSWHEVLPVGVGGRIVLLFWLIDK